MGRLALAGRILIPYRDNFLEKRRKKERCMRLKNVQYSTDVGSLSRHSAPPKYFLSVNLNTAPLSRTPISYN